MASLDRESAKKLFEKYRKQRNGIRNCPEMASVCLICGSFHIVPKEGEVGVLTCRNCGFCWFRYVCSPCGKTIDGRDPLNPGCRKCGLRICTCGACGCPSDGTTTDQGGEG